MNKQEVIEKLKEYGAWCTECHDIHGEKDRYVKVAKVRELLEQLDQPQKVRAKLAEHWDEDTGDVLWWNFPVEEPPYCGTPLDEHFPSYKTHFTQITMPDEVEEEPKWVVKSNRLYFTGITQLIARDPITYNFTTDENRAHVFDDKESAEKEASFFDGTVEQVEV